jgi:hypothetical protein
LKLSDKHWTASENISALLFFGVLIIMGYLSVIATVYEMATGKAVIGNRPDI